MNGMGKTISTLGTYLVLVFFAAQFVAYFNWTNLGLIMADQGGPRPCGRQAWAACR